MTNIIYQATVLILIIILGYIGKMVGIFSKERDLSTISKIILYLTLPSAIITNLNGLRFPPILLLLTIFGFLSNWLYILISKLTGKNSTEQSFLALNINGFNIGNFAFPFIAYFLDGLPILAVSLYDAGNAIMGLGGNYAVAKSIKEEESQFDGRNLLKVISQSPTVIVYALMVIFSLLSMDLPKMVVDVAAIIGRANTFLPMLFIGIALELKFKAEDIQKLFKYSMLRYVPAIILAVIIYFLPIIGLEIKHALILILLSPVAGTAPIFTELIDGDVELSAQLNSLSIILSVILMSSYLILMGI